MSEHEPEIKYCDNHLLVADKPPGMLTQADRTGDPDLLSTCREYVARRFNKPGNVYLGLVHRLDRPASGLVVFARTSKAAARLSAQFRERTVSKKYLVLVEGAMTGGGELRDYVRKDLTGVTSATPDHPDGRLAELEWTALAGFGNCSLLQIDLLTGRKHQIRFQLSRAGHPVIGDFRYGSTTKLDGRNIALHGYRLAVDHPTRRERLVWNSSPPSVWGELRLHADAWIRQHASNAD